MSSAPSFYSNDEQKSSELKRVLYSVSAVLYHHIVSDAASSGADYQNVISEFCESTHTGIAPRSLSISIDNVDGDHSDGCSSDEEAVSGGSIVPTHHCIYNFLLKMYQRGDFMPCAAVVSLILIHRLSRAHQMPLTPDNWKCVCVISLMVAQKLFDDVPLANGEFSILYQPLSKRAINMLEIKFLNLLKYHVDVEQRLYWQYHAELLAIVPADFESRMAAVSSRNRPPLSPSLSRLCMVSPEPMDAQDGDDASSSSSSAGRVSPSAVSLPRLALSPTFTSPALSSTSSSRAFQPMAPAAAAAAAAAAAGPCERSGAKCLCSSGSRMVGRRHSCDTAVLAAAASLLAAAAVNYSLSGPAASAHHKSASVAVPFHSRRSSLGVPSVPADASPSSTTTAPAAAAAAGVGSRFHMRRNSSCECSSTACFHRVHQVSRCNSCDSTPGSILACHVDSKLIRTAHDSEQPCKLTTHVY